MTSSVCQRCGLPYPPRPPFETCWACETLEDPVASIRMWQAGLEDLAARQVPLAQWLEARTRQGYPLRDHRHQQALIRLDTEGS